MLQRTRSLCHATAFPPAIVPAAKPARYTPSGRQMRHRRAASQVTGISPSSVDFFHLDCLSSEVRLNVDLDAVLTVLAHGCYRWLATQLHGFGQAKPKSVYCKVEFANT